MLISRRLTGTVPGSPPLVLPAQSTGTNPAAQRPITIVVPHASGGPIHFVGRLLGVRLSRLLGEPVVVENRPGQSGLSGACYAGEAAPDGRTLLLATNGLYAITMNILSCRFDFTSGLAPIGLVARTPLVLCVPAGSPLTSLTKLTRTALAAPGALRYVTPHAYHLPTLLLADILEISLTSVLVSGALPGLEALDRGDAEFALLELGAAVPFVHGGRLRALGIAAAARAAQLPEVPTLAEAGLPGFEVATDFALFARAGTPDEALARLSEASIAALSGADVRALLAPIGVEPMGGTRAAFPAYFEAENRPWLSLIRQLDITTMERPR
ncbi:tripartite tricarboxylate transporter substrate binding protein [Roseococcus sp. SDR]|uniref:tripartite tricarboxylate transporter substrate binding protein n=1 Tax=Roseococcus sp. SDR TaxID=2835532 RepID=UPI001BCC66C5|nr:tripartite tricarboxylate transporter substrate binding protein [Roseococcus sp. SDR]MBS7791383.1 tripartite tricarboxylate transporter substrate binding protein [Roseococcus sp. SDR]MBV1846697.1 tripartite tricarboxylate transporter substrate binding protein [Roseococcus sp. SDR]